MLNDGNLKNILLDLIPGSNIKQKLHIDLKEALERYEGRFLESIFPDSKIMHMEGPVQIVYEKYRAYVYISSTKKLIVFAFNNVEDYCFYELVPN